MSWRLRILGCNSAIPTLERFTTSQILQTNNKNYIIDCGEGMQIRLHDSKIKKNKIHEIFISHLHGDHFFGLPGLLTSLNLSNRTLPLKIYGPKGLQKYINTLTEIGSFYLNYPVEIEELNSEVFQLIHADNEVEVFSFPMKHRIPTTGFLFKQKPLPRKIKVESIKEFELSIDQIKQLKSGKDVSTKDDKLLKFSEHTFEPQNLNSYAFCSDTLYDEELIQYISGASLLYHEATYLDDLKEKAKERMHSTSKDAARIAQKANVGKLLLGHYSSRYKILTPFLEESRSIFKETYLAEDSLEVIF